MTVLNVRRSACWMIGAIIAFSLTAIAGREATYKFAESPLTISQLVFFRNIIGLILISFVIMFIAIRLQVVKLFIKIIL